MICPYCNNEMLEGNLNGDGRGGVHWKEGTRHSSVIDKICGTGELTATSYTAFSRFQIDCHYCPRCKKIIIDTEVTR